MLSKQKTRRDRLPDAERTEVLAPLPVAELRKYEAVKKAHPDALVCFEMCIRDSTKPFKRLWISSLEDSAIREGFRHLRDGKEYDRLYEAALSRSKADWIVGINGTRLFTTLYHKKLVVGRVQI